MIHLQNKNEIYMNYYIQTSVGTQGNYNIHRVGCHNMPLSLTRLYLGNFINIIQAIQAAKKINYKFVNVCSCCVTRKSRY